jgi:hypothetical protein
LPLIPCPFPPKGMNMLHHNKNQSFEAGNWPKIPNVLHMKYTSENGQCSTYLYNKPTSEMSCISNILQTMSNILV